MYKINKLRPGLFCKVFLLLFLVCGSCSKDDSPSEDILPVDGNRLKTMKGESLGIAVTKKIGSEGGTIVLAAEGISMTIPAGAVKEETNFGIEMITSTNPAAVGKAYRITPASITLLKPVKIELPLEKMKDEVSVPDALALACQTADGYWNMLDSRKTDDVNGQLETFTRHLGDFSPMQWLFLKPSLASVAVNQSIELEAIRYIAAPADPDGFLVVPLVPKNGQSETPVLNPVALEPGYIKKWELSGPGTLTSSGNKATYQALSSLQSGNKAAVRIELKTTSNTTLLLSNLKITTDGYLKIRINNGPSVSLNGEVSHAYYDNTVFRIVGLLPDNDTKKPFVLTGKIKEGSYPWDDNFTGGKNGTKATFAYSIPSGGYYVEWFEPKNGVPYQISPGNLQILEISKTGDYIMGKFSASSAGFYNSNREYVGEVRIEGEFKTFFMNVADNISIQKRGTKIN